MGKNSLRIPYEKFAANPNFVVKYPLSIGGHKGNIAIYTILIIALLIFVAVFILLIFITSTHTTECKCENPEDVSVFEDKCIERGCDWDKKLDNGNIGLIIFYVVAILALLGGCYALYKKGISKKHRNIAWEKVRDACITGNVRTKEQVLQCMERVYLSKRAGRVRYY